MFKEVLLISYSPVKFSPHSRPRCFAPAASAQTSSSNTAAYQNRCASCHGATMTGASGPAILTYIRYHTDAEVTAAIRERHRNIPAVSVPDAELPRSWPACGNWRARIRRWRRADLPDAGAARWRRRKRSRCRTCVPRRCAAAPARGAAPPTPVSQGIEGLQPTTIKMADGRARTGVLLAQSEVSAVLLENGRFTTALEGWKPRIVKKPSRRKRIGRTTTAV